jgi:D-serine deaminase-like pyridoxal phosphate-dependent protein
MRVDDVDTPALIVDLEAFEHNLAAMRESLRGAKAPGLRLRPHAKTHKSPDIAKAQIVAGAVGVCCQKVSEAEAMVDGGIGDVLITNEVVGTRKTRRIAALGRRARIGVCVDHPLQVDQLALATLEAGTTIDVYVEIDVGMGRCGAEMPADAVALARRIGAIAGLRFSGLQAYHGRAQHLREPVERERAIAHAERATRAAVSALNVAGISCERITGGGTGTYPIELASGLWNELQPGSYVFMDVDYGRNRLAPSAVRFRNSLYVLASVMSTNGARLVLDAGLKAYSVDSGLPQVPDAPGWQFARATDEHGVLTPASSAPALPVEIGAKLKLIPGHCDPTANMHDWYVAVRGDVVEAVWPITARGALA